MAKAAHPVPAEVPTVGSPAPDFTLKADDGSEVTLSALRGRRVVLFFYPKDMTSGCTAQACGFREHHPAFTEAGTEVFGISPDGQASHAKFRAAHALPYRLLVDEGHRVAERYGVWQEKSMYGKKYFGVVRSHFVIDEEGRIADAQYRVSPEESVERAVAQAATGASTERSR
jgi:peroxiredoxin Q/BCP